MNSLLAQLLALNQAVAAKIERGEPVTAPGVPRNYPDAKSLVTEDCIRPTKKSHKKNASAARRRTVTPGGDETCAELGGLRA